jgi:hypothetical protein
MPHGEGFCAVGELASAGQFKEFLKNWESNHGKYRY